MLQFCKQNSNNWLVVQEVCLDIHQVQKLLSEKRLTAIKGFFILYNNPTWEA